MSQPLLPLPFLFPFPSEMLLRITHPPLLSLPPPAPHSHTSQGQAGQESRGRPSVHSVYTGYGNGYGSGVSTGPHLGDGTQGPETLSRALGLKPAPPSLTFGGAGSRSGSRGGGGGGARKAIGESKGRDPERRRGRSRGGGRQILEEVEGEEEGDDDEEEDDDDEGEGEDGEGVGVGDTFETGSITGFHASQSLLCAQIASAAASALSSTLAPALVQLHGYGDLNGQMIVDAFTGDESGLTGEEESVGGGVLAPSCLAGNARVNASRAITAHTVEFSFSIYRGFAKRFV